jgi:predicted DNA binding CopG/RHH family protein
MPRKKEIPKFEKEDQEREFWSKEDSTDYIDWQAANRAVFSNLKPSTRKISLRLPETMIEELKLLANKRDIPSQNTAGKSLPGANPGFYRSYRRRLPTLVQYRRPASQR